MKFVSSSQKGFQSSNKKYKGDFPQLLCFHPSLEGNRCHQPCRQSSNPFLPKVNFPSSRYHFNKSIWLSPYPPILVHILDSFMSPYHTEQNRQVNVGEPRALVGFWQVNIAPLWSNRMPVSSSHLHSEPHLNNHGALSPASDLTTQKSIYNNQPFVKIY